MGKGDDDQVYVLRGKVQVQKTGPKLLKKVDMPRVKQNRFGSFDQIGLQLLVWGLCQIKA
jgi:hypothetical protein